jgi:hypothetical protein
MLRSSLLLAAAAAAEAASDGLIVSNIDAAEMFKLAFADHGSGAIQDLSVWSVTQSVAAAGWRVVGHAAHASYGTAPSLVVVKAGSDAAALAAPTGLTLKWEMSSTGAGAFYTPQCAAGYAPLGSVATEKAGAKPSDFPGLVCVADKYLTAAAPVKLLPIWSCKGSKHYKMDGTTWSQPALKTEQGEIAMPFVAGDPTSYSKPNGDRRTIDVAKVKVVVLPKPPPPPPAPLVVEQVHLALGHSVDTMAVAWATVSAQPCEAMVMYGSSASALSKTNPGNSRIFTQDPDRSWYTHAANMTGLVPGERYWYKVGNKNGSTEAWSKVFSFKAATTAKPKPGQPQLHVIFGDMGAPHAYSLCPDCGSEDNCTCTNTSLGVVSETSADMILHLGDFAYNLDSDKGLMGDIFMRNIEPIAAQVPYMVSVGNHENSPEALASYTERFRHVPSNSGLIKSTNGVAPNNWWYSWDSGLVHYVAISTELYFGIKSVGDSNTCAKQLEWIKADLAKANANRANVPWIVVHGHRSIYCSCDGDCDGSATTVREGSASCGGLEELFFGMGVDFFINGHGERFGRATRHAFGHKHLCHTLTLTFVRALTLSLSDGLTD